MYDAAALIILTLLLTVTWLLYRRIHHLGDLLGQLPGNHAEVLRMREAVQDANEERDEAIADRERVAGPVERRMIAEALEDMADDDLAAGEMARTMLEVEAQLPKDIRQNGIANWDRFANNTLDEAYRRKSMYVSDLPTVSIVPINAQGKDGHLELRRWPAASVDDGVMLNSGMHPVGFNAVPDDLDPNALEEIPDPLRRDDVQ